MMLEANTIVSQAVEAAIKKKNKRRKVDFEDDPGAFCDPGIEESDSEGAGIIHKYIW